MLLWGLITGGALVVAGTLFCVYLITVRHRAPSWERMHKPGICFYLDEDDAMDLYRQEEKYPDLQRSVRETIRRNTDKKVQLQRPPVSAGVTAANEEEQISESIKNDGPITVIGRIIPALDNANDIVYVDLFNCTLWPSVDLNRALERTHGRRATQVRATELQKLVPFTFVSVMGRFRVTAKSRTTTTFAAPFGDPTELSADLPTVSVTCNTTKLRRKVPEDPFPARCLGKIKYWDPGTRQLVISPVLAIFQ
jgi:hypothetical protein